jgi:hypothetical protein
VSEEEGKWNCEYAAFVPSALSLKVRV